MIIILNTKCSACFPFQMLVPLFVVCFVIVRHGESVPVEPNSVDININISMYILAIHELLCLFVMRPSLRTIDTKAMTIKTTCFE